MAIEEYEQPAPVRIEIEGANGVSLRELFIDDAEEYAELVRKNAAHLNVQHEGGTDDMAQKYGAPGQIRHYILDGKSTGHTMFWIYQNQEKVGGISSVLKDGQPAEIAGLWVDKDHIKQGIATEAVKDLADHLFANGTEKIITRIYKGNDTSRNRFVKNGFIWEKLDEEENSMTGEKKYIDQLKLEKPHRYGSQS